MCHNVKEWMVMSKKENQKENEMNKKVSEIMKTDVYTVSDEATIKDVLQLSLIHICYLLCGAQQHGPRTVAGQTNHTIMC